MRQSLQNIILIGLFSSLVFVSTLLKVFIPIPGGCTLLNFGHVSCLLAGLLLGAEKGALAAAFGSTLFEFFSPLSFSSAPFTFFSKFLLAHICGKIYENKNVAKNLTIRVIFSSSISSAVYIFLHILKVFIYNYYFLKISFYASIFIVFKSIVFSIIKVFFTIFLVVFVMKKLEKLNLVKKFEATS